MRRLVRSSVRTSARASSAGASGLRIPAVGQEVVQGLTASSMGIELSVEGSRERGEGWKNAFIVRKTSETGLEALSYLKIKRSTSSLLYKHTFSAPDQT